MACSRLVMSPASPRLMKTPRTFGQLPGGETVEAWTLNNAAGASLQVITFGAIVSHLRVPDRRGQLDDVVLGFDALAPYLAGHPYFGATVGRVAGRITGGRFCLGDQRFQLAPNDPPNHLHGGNVGFDRKLWHAVPVDRADGADAVRLTLQSPDGDEGYPGPLNASVTFTLTGDNALVYETEVSAPRPTPASLTHHSYFNLAGEGAGPVTDHEFQIFSGFYAPTDAAMTLLGRREAVDGLGCDFRQPRRLGDALPGLPGSHGDLYFTGAGSSVHHEFPVSIARVKETRYGRVLEVRTTEECLQFYSGVSLDGSLRGKSGTPYGPHQGFCLECEGYPDGVNTPALGDIVLHPDQPRRHTTVYAFSAE